MSNTDKDDVIIGCIQTQTLYVIGDETIEVITPDSYTIETNRPSFFKGDVDNNSEYKRGDDECYYLKASMEVDYKVTKKEVDYKEVLSKYIDYIECREGTNFLSDADDDDFSTEELKAIRGL